MPENVMQGPKALSFLCFSSLSFSSQTPSQIGIPDRLNLLRSLSR